MKLFLVNREQLQSLGSFLVSELDSIVARVRGAWSVEHTEDDKHGHVHAQSLASGRVTLSDIVEDTITVATLNNYEPGGINTAGMLRLNSTLSEVSITGLRSPQDELGTVLDGRLLAIENTSTVTVFALEQEGTASFPNNRFSTPWEPSTTGTSARLFLFPATITILSYDSKRARWMVLSRSNEEVIATATVAASKNDFPTPATDAPGFRAARTVRIDATAVDLTFSGFDATNVPAPSRKTVTNVGNYKFAILHQSTSSLAANRVQCPGGVRYMLHPRESVDLYRITTGGWRIIEKADQWIDVAFVAGNYTTSGGGSWTVASGNVATHCYQIDGNKMTVAFNISASTIATSPTILTIAIPNARTATRAIRSMVTLIISGVEETGIAQVLAGGTVIQIKRLNAAAFANSATNGVNGEITFWVFDATAGISETHTDVAHGDTAHADVAHSDVTHVDTAHGDSHGDSTHTDAAHSDVAHVDTTSHSDTAHEDVTHIDSAHGDVAHSDTAHSDITHGDITHDDHTDNITPAPHVDVPHEDQAHSDAAHSDSHTDTAHSDTAHSDTAHSDSSSHADTAHADTAHVDGGHADTHSDTAPHADTAHVDVVHSDTAHSDNLHEDVGLHTDSAHSDI